MKAKPYATFEPYGRIGRIDDEATYEKVRRGEADWKPHIKAKITHVQIPIAVFNRLIELDKQPIVTVELSKKPFEESEDCAFEDEQFCTKHNKEKEDERCHT